MDEQLMVRVLDLAALLTAAKGKHWITGRAPGNETLCIRITEEDRELLERLLRGALS
jgi:hypothetical protein